MKAIVYILLAFLSFTSNFIYAQNGSLDISFNNTGSVLTDFGVYDSSVHSMVLQPNGKIIVAGTVFDHGDYSQFSLLRFNSDGSIDTTFGNLGLVEGNFLQTKMSLNTVALQSNGKILTAGIIYNNYSDSQFVVARLNTDGSLDTTFGNTGFILGDFININTMLVQSDDKIVLAGFSFDAINRDFTLLRYNKDGAPDTGFGTNGIVSTNIGVRDFGYDIALQTDGKIVLAGSTQNNGGSHFSDFAVIRYYPDGNLDTIFGTTGLVILDEDDIDEAKSIEIQNDGKIVLAGWSYSSTGLNETFKMIRLLPDGTLDPGFGSSGIALSPIAFSSNQQLITFQSDSKILVVGKSATGTTNNFAIVRFLSDGNVDTSFGVSGVVTTSDGSETHSEANAILGQPDGKILAGGESGEASLSYHPQSVLRRYN